MRKAKKDVHPMPELAFWDHCIYIFLIIVFLALGVGLLFVTFKIRDMIAMQDPLVIAVEDPVSLLWCIPAVFCVMIIPFAFLATCYKERRPIFGRRNFRYGPPTYPRIYPLFAKKKPKEKVSQYVRKYRRFTAMALLAVFLVCLLLLPLSFYGRKCLRSDASVNVYNMYNAETKHYTKADVKKVVFDTYRAGSKGSYWSVQVILTMENGKSYYFGVPDFVDGASGGNYHWLSEMTKIKEAFPSEQVYYSGENKINAVIARYEMNQEEAALFQRLFS